MPRPFTGAIALGLLVSMYLASSGCGGTQSLTGLSQIVAPRQPFEGHHLFPMTHHHPPSEWYHPAPVLGMPGYFRLRTGEIILGPPNVLRDLPRYIALAGYSPQVQPLVKPTPKPSPTPTPTPYPCPSSASWNGSGTPPPCDMTGAFHRVYTDDRSSQGYASASSVVYAPTQAGLPTYPPKDGSTGFIYIEAWPLSNPGNTAEGGFEYSPGSTSAPTRYNQYSSNAADGFQVGTTIYPPTDTCYPNCYMSFGLGLTAVGYPNNTPPQYLETDTNQSCVVAGTWHGCLSDFHQSPLPSGYGSWNCCRFALMTTIAQCVGTSGNCAANSNRFSDGAKFSDVEYSDLCTSWVPPGAMTESSGCSYPQFPPNPIAGEQSFPPDATKVIVQFSSAFFGGWGFPQLETVTIDLHS